MGIIVAYLECMQSQHFKQLAIQDFVKCRIGDYSMHLTDTKLEWTRLSTDTFWSKKWQFVGWDHFEFWIAHTAILHMVYLKSFKEQLLQMQAEFVSEDTMRFAKKLGLQLGKNSLLCICIILKDVMETRNRYCAHRVQSTQIL